MISSGNTEATNEIKNDCYKSSIHLKTSCHDSIQRNQRRSEQPNSCDPLVLSLDLFRTFLLDHGLDKFSAQPVPSSRVKIMSFPNRNVYNFRRNTRFLHPNVLASSMIFVAYLEDSKLLERAARAQGQCDLPCGTDPGIGNEKRTTQNLTSTPNPKVYTTPTKNNVAILHTKLTFNT